MKYYAEEKRLTVHKKFIEIECDMCHTMYDTEEWGGTGHRVLETEIRIREGYYFSDDPIYTEFSCDICPTCFKNKLIPWLENQGVIMKKDKY